VIKVTSSDILLIEDDEDVAEMLADHLSHSLEASVRLVRDGEEAFEQVLELMPDLVVADLLLPGENALSFIRRLKSVASVPVILMTGEPTLGRAVEAIRLGVVDLFTKPFDLDRLSRVAGAALEQSRRERRAAKRVQRLRGIAARVKGQRRHLQRQLDLVCRDLVQAHRHLAERVHAMQVGREDSPSVPDDDAGPTCDETS
jgi:DNA-binding NtrC family response regulator